MTQIRAVLARKEKEEEMDHEAGENTDSVENLKNDKESRSM